MCSKEEVEDIVAEVSGKQKKDDADEEEVEEEEMSEGS